MVSIIWIYTFITEEFFLRLWLSELYLLCIIIYIKSVYTDFYYCSMCDAKHMSMRISYPHFSLIFAIKVFWGVLVSQVSHFMFEHCAILHLNICRQEEYRFCCEFQYDSVEEECWNTPASYFHLHNLLVHLTLVHYIKKPWETDIHLLSQLYLKLRQYYVSHSMINFGECVLAIA